MIGAVQLLLAEDLHVQADYGQIYIYPAGADATADDPYMTSLTDAQHSRRFVGAADNFIDLMTPGQWNFTAPMRIEVWTGEPNDDRASWDHEVDLDIDVPDGRLIFEASGGGTPIPASIPQGTYRMRVSGRGYTALGLQGADGDDSYRLRLWPRTDDKPPELRKYWPGWDDYR